MKAIFWFAAIAIYLACMGAKDGSTRYYLECGAAISLGTFALRNRGRKLEAISWPLVTFSGMLCVATELAKYLSRRHAEVWLDRVACVVFIWLLFLGGRGLGKKLWGKITSSGLTTINADSFRRQSSEAA